MENLLNEMKKAPKAQVLLTSYDFQKEWNCSFESTTDAGLKVNIAKSGKTPHDAVSATYAVFVTLAAHAKDINTPLLDAPKPSYVTPRGDDDIPL